MKHVKSLMSQVVPSENSVKIYDSAVSSLLYETLTSELVSSEQLEHSDEARQKNNNYIKAIWEIKQINVVLW